MKNVPYGSFFFWLCYNLQMNKFSQILEKIQVGILLAMIALVPLYFDPSVFQAFSVPKRLIFEVLFCSWLFIWVARIYQAQHLGWPRGRMLGGLLLGYLGVVLVSILSSALFSVSTFGSTLRAYGALLQLELFLIFCWLVIDYKLIKNYLTQIYLTVSGVGFLISLYAITQALGRDPLHWAEPGKVMMRVTSTIGQPNFLASTMLLTLAISVLAIKVTRQNWLKILLTVSSVAQLSCIILTLSRGAWLGLAVATLVFLFTYLFNQKRRLFYAGMFGLLISFGTLFYLGSLSQDQVKGLDSWSVKDRIISLTDFKQGSIRALYYRASIDLISRKWLLGYGADMLGFYSHAYYNSTWPVYETLNQATDKAHNFFLDVWLDGGVVGFAWWVFLIYYIWLLTTRDLKFEQGVYLFGLVSVFISWQVSLVTLEQALLFWLVAGLYLGSQTASREIKIRRPLIGVFAFLVLGIFGLATVRDSQALIGGQLYRQVLLNAQSAEAVRLSSIIELLKAAPPADIQRYYGAQVYVQLSDMAQRKKLDRNLLEEIIKALDEYDQQPMTFEWQINRLIFSEIIFRDKLSLPIGKEVFDQLYSQFAELKKDAPGYALVELAWGNLHYYHGDCTEANRHYQKALALYPSLDDPELNTEHKRLVDAERSQVVAALKTCENILNREILIKVSENDLKVK